jgi:hypothetical protein
MKEAGPTITVKNIGVEVAKATGVSESHPIRKRKKNIKL